MFQKLRTERFFKVRSGGNAISVGFTGRAAKIAKIHQYGLRGRTEQTLYEVRYERREIFGFSTDTIDLVRNTLLEQLII